MARGMRISVWASVAVLSIALSTGAWASPHHRHHGAPAVFSHDGASAIGHARQRYDLERYESYRGNAGAQFQLRQKRQNLCRNAPQMC